MSEEWGKGVSVPGADNQWISEMVFGVELMGVFGSKDEESAVCSAEDKAFNVLDGNEFGKSEFRIEEAESSFCHEKSGLIFDSIDIN